MPTRHMMATRNASRIAFETKVWYDAKQESWANTLYDFAL